MLKAKTELHRAFYVLLQHKRTKDLELAGSQAHMRIPDEKAMAQGGTQGPHPARTFQSKQGPLDFSFGNDDGKVMRAKMAVLKMLSKIPEQREIVQKTRGLYALYQNRNAAKYGETIKQLDQEKKKSGVKILNSLVEKKKIQLFSVAFNKCLNHSLRTD